MAVDGLSNKEVNRLKIPSQKAAFVVIFFCCNAEIPETPADVLKSNSQTLITTTGQSVSLNLNSTDVLSVQHRVTFTDGRELDSSNSRAKPATFQQNDHVSGISFDEYIESEASFIPENPSAYNYEFLIILLRSLLKPENEQDLEIHYDFSKQQKGAFIELLIHLSIHDDIPAALRILYELWRTDSESVRKYPKLAVAFALVWDQPLGTNWVRHALPPDILKPGTESIPERFAFYIRSAKEQRLENDPAKLSTRELMFVVDCPLPLPELEWAQKNVRQSRSKFHTVYFSIPYDQQRFNNYLTSENDPSAYLWPYPDYSLMTIKEKGGVCAEQAHFAVSAAQAKAIPAIYFGGSGTTSFHAWMGYMKCPGHWQLDVGKYTAENLPFGEAIDPQTRRVISDDEIRLLTTLAKKTVTPGKYPALFRTWSILKMRPEQRAALVMLFEKNLHEQDSKQYVQKQLSQIDPFVLRLLELARTHDPNDIQSWRIESLLLQYTDAPPEKLRAQLEKRAEQFSSYNEFYTEALEPLIPLLRKLGETQKADELQKELLRKNRRKRFDLSIDIGADRLLQKIDAEDWQAAHQEFRKIIRRFGEKGGGTLFYNLVVPYINALQEAKQQKLLEDSFKYIDRHMTITPGTQLHNQYIKLRKNSPSAQRGTN